MAGFFYAEVEHYHGAFDWLMFGVLPRGVTDYTQDPEAVQHDNYVAYWLTLEEALALDAGQSLGEMTVVQWDVEDYEDAIKACGGVYEDR